MYHFIEAITNTKGDALIGFFVKAIVPSTGDVASMYSDASGTPIETVSGIENACEVNSDGMASFFIDDGEYHLAIYATNGTTEVRRIENIAMAKTGMLIAANVGVLATLDTTYPAVLTASGVQGIFIFDTSDLSSEVDNDPAQYTYVAPVDDPTGESGAWVRAQQANLLTPDTETRVLNGCGVAYSGTALSLNMSAGTYKIDGNIYAAEAQSITLDAADSSNPRIDTLYLNTSGVLSVHKGTASANPSQPATNAATECFLTFVLVPAGASSLSGVTSEDIYLENTEWTTSLLGTGFNPASTNNPYLGTKCIESTGTLESPDYIKFTRSSPMSFDGDGNLILRIRSKGTWNSKRGLILQFALSSVDKGQPLLLKSGAFGFDSAVTSSYQLIVISKSLFSVPAGTSINELRITETGTSGQPTGFYIDNITLQNNGTTIGSGVPSGLTTEQADARYLKLTGGTTSGPIYVPDVAYNAGTWDGDASVPTKNAVRDALQSISGGSLGALLAANNLSDVASAATSRTNLGLGTAATQPSTAFRAASPSIQSVTSAATVTPTFSDDMVKITAQAAALALANPTGTAVPGWGIAIRIKDNGTARAITYGTQYRAIGVTLPTTTVISKTLYLGLVYNSDDTKWDVVAVAQEA